MKYLIDATVNYRFDAEGEMQAYLDELKKDTEVIKYSTQHKEKKSKGEIVDEWYKVSVTRKFNDEKEPEDTTTDIHFGAEENESEEI